MKQDDFRQRLIEGTIHVIANDGLDKATTKQIGTYTGINEAYIYRCFKGKEDMIVKAFDTLDEELLAKTMQHVEIMYMPDIEYEMRCRMYFFAVWKFLLNNQERCVAYMSYLYSVYFGQHSIETHKKRFEVLVKKFDDAFYEEANTWMLLNYVLTTALDFAVKVFQGQVSDSEDTAEHVFRVIYQSIKQYFRNSKERNS